MSQRTENLRPQASLRCKYCGCETNKDTIKAAHWTRKGLIVIEDIPARLCQGCGEEFFEAEIAQKIQKILTYPAAKAKQQIRVPVYSLLKVQAAVPARQNTMLPESGCRETFLCRYCKSATVEKLVKSVLWVDGRLIAIENIPARVCRQCREQFYDDQTIEKMTTLGKGGFLPGTTERTVLVPVFSLTDTKESLGKRPLLRKNR